MSDNIVSEGLAFVLVCPCGGIPEHEQTPWSHNIVCRRCYDGAADSKCYFGSGDTFAEAVDDWNFRVEDEMDDRKERASVAT